MKANSLLKSLYFIATITFSINVFANNPEEKILLENDALKVEFDKKTGTLVYMEYKKQGRIIQKRQQLAQSFKMWVPTTDRSDNSILGKEHSLSRYNLKGNKLIFEWENLNSTTVRNLNIKFTGIVELKKEGLVFTGSLENKSNLTVEAIFWPYFGDLYLPDKENETNWMNFRYAGGLEKTPIYPTFKNIPGYHGVDYPIQIHNVQYSHFGLIQSNDQGIYVGYHDTTDRINLNFTFELKPGFEYCLDSWMRFGKVAKEDTIDGKLSHYEFYCTHFPYTNTNETTELDPIVFNPYQGDWHSGADFYKKWRTTWSNTLPLPEWASDVHAWMQIQINSAEDRPMFPYNRLTDYCKECLEYKVKAIQLTGWTNGGQDRGIPSHDTDPLLGTYDDLKNAISACEKMGVKIILFNKYTWADQSQDWFKNELINYSIKDQYGNYRVYPGYQYVTPMQLSDINTRRLIPMCPLSDAWRKIAVKEFNKSIELGASGMLYDENQHHGGAMYCFDKNHGHHVPASIYPGDKLLQDDFTKVKQQKKPDYLFCGESNRDLQFQSYQMTYFRIEGNHIPMHRYVAPKEKMIMTIGGHNDRKFVNIALKNNFILSYEPRNFKGQLKEIPRTMQYGRMMDSLRKKYKEYLWDGIFMDTEGVKVFNKNEQYADYSVFVNPKNGKQAIVIVNNDFVSSVTISLNTKKDYVQVSPENLKENTFGGSISIGPLSAVVLIEK